MSKGCPCKYCSWYLNPRDYCSDPYRRPVHKYPRWSFASAQELADAYQNDISDDLIGRSMAFLEEEMMQAMISELIAVKPMADTSSLIQIGG